MKIIDRITENYVFLDLNPRDKKQALDDFVSALEERNLIEDKNLVLDALLKREALGSTGLENGIAIPHALIDGIKESLVALALIRDGVDFESADNQPTHVIFILLGKKDNPGDQLKMLAHICRMVRETDFMEKFKNVKTPLDVCQLLKRMEDKME
jgi:mannitol/fructose-specific phosphotransferase system IIA component (Ntr-type)